MIKCVCGLPLCHANHRLFLGTPLPLDKPKWLSLTIVATESSWFTTYIDKAGCKELMKELREKMKELS